MVMFCLPRTIDNVLLAGLLGLTLGAHFNQTMDNVTLPAGLHLWRYGRSQRRDLRRRDSASGREEPHDGRVLQPSTLHGTGQDAGASHVRPRLSSDARWPCRAASGRCAVASAPPLSMRRLCVLGSSCRHCLQRRSADPAGCFGAGQDAGASHVHPGLSADARRLCR